MVDTTRVEDTPMKGERSFILSLLHYMPFSIMPFLSLSFSLLSPFQHGTVSSFPQFPSPLDSFIFILLYFIFFSSFIFFLYFLYSSPSSRSLFDFSPSPYISPPSPLSFLTVRYLPLFIRTSLVIFHSFRSSYLFSSWK